jgi:hypothetical protein
MEKNKCFIRKKRRFLWEITRFSIKEEKEDCFGKKQDFLRNKTVL